MPEMEPHATPTPPNEDPRPEPDPLVTIAVPTFNRASKLARLLECLEAQIGTPALAGQVAVLVANNASADNTREILDAVSSRALQLKHFTHSENLGFDRNILFLYQHVTSPYIWFMGDDDLPLNGAIDAVLDTLKSHRPDVLLAPFIQPPGTWRREDEFSGPCRVITDPGPAIDSVDQHGKMSSYILRKLELNRTQTEEVHLHAGAGWLFKVLAFTVLQASPALKLVLLSAPAATSDDEFYKIAFHPDVFLNAYTPFLHSLVRKWIPKLAEQRRGSDYRYVIQFLWTAQMGEWLPTDARKWDEFAATLDWRWQYLWCHPLAVIRLCLVKLDAGYVLRRSQTVAALRSAWNAIWLYCREAEWLFPLRCQRRQLRAYFRHKRFSGDRG